MLYAVGRYEERLHFYTSEKEEDVEMLKGSDIRKYLAHILVCRNCHEYLFKFMTLLDSSVLHHPCPQHTDVSKGRLNDVGIPIFEYVLDADFDILRDKAYYGVSDDIILDGAGVCYIVDNFMSKYVLPVSSDGPVVVV